LDPEVDHLRAVLAVDDARLLHLELQRHAGRNLTSDYNGARGGRKRLRFGDRRHDQTPMWLSKCRTEGHAQQSGTPVASSMRFDFSRFTLAGTICKLVSTCRPHITLLLSG